MIDRLTGAASRASDEPEDWKETTADEQLRFDQCLMSDGLRLGGLNAYGLAQDALNQSPEKLHELAELDDTFSGPLSRAYDKDQEDWKNTWERLRSQETAWGAPLNDLNGVPGWFTRPDGTRENDNFYAQTGLDK
ncbi:hypothetical protein AB0I49_13145 [Streptomyces sp. NPDC050617]|uniref:hypothetical protein n=1 Tax=Streptomyces sp. NPDC050617 TaxID=3154628 RepID=UPI00341B5157